MGYVYKSGALIERTNWIEVGKYYPHAGDRIMLFFPKQEIPVVFATYDDWDNWVPRPTHWARALEGPRVVK